MTKPLSKMSRRELTDACIKGQQRSADLAAYVKRLGEERDAYQDMAQCMSFDLTSMGEERDAWQRMSEQYKREAYTLAAYVEDGKMLVRELLVDDTTDDATHLTEWAELESPTASLARLKAEWRAEVLEELIQNTSQFREANPVRGLAGSMADELRRQVEGED